MTSLQLGGYDPLDVQLDDVALAPSRPTSRRSIRRLAWWSASSVPVASLLLVGVALGPAGINLMSRDVLTLVDPAIPVALAALGALLGLSIDVRRAGFVKQFGAALVGSSTTVIIIATGFALVASALLLRDALPVWASAAVIGLAAATSLAVPGGDAGESRSIGSRIVGVEAVLPIVLAGLLLATLQGGPTSRALALVGQAALVACAFGASSWLLLTRATSGTEQRVFVFAGMLLIGGAADYLSLSALLNGVVVGFFWQMVGGRSREWPGRDAIYLQHTLLVLVLVVAGARSNIGLEAAAAALAYVLLRLATRLAGGVAAARLVGARDRREVIDDFLPPGVFGIALAVDVSRAVDPHATVLLTIVMLGSIGSELIAALALPDEREELPQVDLLEGGA